MQQRNYWAFRIDKRNREYFKKELLEKQQLRQGWGYNEGQNLRNMTVDEGAKRNLPIMKKVKKGDMLLVPDLYNLGTISIVEALEDFDKGYKYEIDPHIGDYGHIFPAKFIKEFARHNILAGGLKLKNPCRFWSLNGYKDIIERIISEPDENLLNPQNYSQRYNYVENEVFKEYEEKMKNLLYKKMNEQMSDTDWEYALVHGLKRLYPDYEINRVGGKSEKDHGCDITITFESPLGGKRYVIAVQVKDYSGIVDNSPIDQICKADTYFEQNDEILLEKWVILTKCDKEINKNLEEYAAEKNVHIYYGTELKELLYKIAMNDNE